LANSDVTELPCAREIFTIFVERYRHNPIGGIEGFLDSVAMMDIDVDV